MATGYPLFILYSTVITLWTTTISSVASKDEIKYYKAGCEKSIIVPPCHKGEYHTWSKEFFLECEKRLEDADVSIRPSAFNPERGCIKFPKLPGAESCAEIKDYKSVVLAISVSLLIFSILLVIGLAIIAYSLFTFFRKRRSASKTTPPTTTPSTQPIDSQPTMSSVANVGSDGDGAVAPPPNDEEKVPG